jgi:hypothetical protein
LRLYRRATRDGNPRQLTSEAPVTPYGLNDAPTLYDRTLHLRVVTDGQLLEETWREEIYDHETDAARYEAQQRIWRIGKGEASAADDEADMRAERLRQLDEQDAEGLSDE